MHSNPSRDASCSQRCNKTTSAHQNLFLLPSSPLNPPLPCSSPHKNRWKRVTMEEGGLSFRSLSLSPSLFEDTINVSHMVEERGRREGAKRSEGGKDGLKWKANTRSTGWDSPARLWHSSRWRSPRGPALPPLTSVMLEGFTTPTHTAPKRATRLHTKHFDTHTHESITSTSIYSCMHGCAHLHSPRGTISSWAAVAEEFHYFLPSYFHSAALFLFLNRNCAHGHNNSWPYMYQRKEKKRKILSQSRCMIFFLPLFSISQGGRMLIIFLTLNNPSALLSEVAENDLMHFPTDVFFFFTKARPFSPSKQFPWREIRRTVSISTIHVLWRPGAHPT